MEGGMDGGKKGVWGGGGGEEVIYALAGLLLPSFHPSPLLSLRWTMIFFKPNYRKEEEREEKKRDREFFFWGFFWSASILP